MDQQLREFILKAYKIKKVLGNPVTKESLKQAVDLGMIPKSDIHDGGYYLGACRNAPVARWNAGLEKFQYLREKHHFVGLDSPIPHPEDDDGFDFFVPVLCLNYSKTLAGENNV